MPLHTNAIVYEIHKKLFNEVLPDLVYKSYHADVKQNTQLLCVEMGYELAEKLLPNILNEQQADCVAAAKCLSVENEKWAIRFAYTRGMFADLYTGKRGTGISKAGTQSDYEDAEHAAL